LNLHHKWPKILVTRLYTLDADCDILMNIGIALRKCQIRT
jgi:hypothetical protein